jgi:hypothetical protein
MVDELVRFHCPNCQKRLKAPPEHVGRRARCTRCGQAVLVPGPVVEPPPVPEPAADNFWDDLPIAAGRPREPEPEPEVWVVEEPRRRTESTSPGRERRVKERPSLTLRPGKAREDEAADAEDPSGNPLARLDLTAANAVQAANLRNKIQKALPEAKSAYRPSGQLPAAGALCLVAGAGAGGIAAGVTRTVLMIVGVFAGTFLAGIVGNMSGGLAIIGVVVLIVGALAYFAMAYVAAGVSAAWVVRLFGRIGKSRSPVAEGVASAIGAGGAIALIWLLTLAFGAELAGEGMKQDDMAIAATIEAMIGGLIAVIAAPIAAVRFVGAAKFCEACQAHLQPRTAKTMPVADLYPAAQALKAGDLDGFRQAIEAARSGPGGKVEVFTCPCCRGGFVELKAGCEFAWKEGNQKKALKAEWLTASVELPAEKMAAAIG